MKLKLWMPLVLLTVLGLPTKALAHSVETNYLLTSELELSAIFSTGEPMKNAKVAVYAPDNPNEPWMEGTTDEEGNFSFLPDKSKPGDWEVSIGQGGHGDILTVPVNETDGVELENISDAKGFSPNLLLIGAACISGGLGTAFLRSRRKL